MVDIRPKRSSPAIEFPTWVFAPCEGDFATVVCCDLLAVHPRNSENWDAR